MSTLLTQHKTLRTNLAKFCEELRRANVPVGLAELLDASRAVDTIDIFDKKQFYFSLRSSLVKDVRHYRTFDALFEAFWAKFSSRECKVAVDFPEEWRNPQESRESPFTQNVEKENAPSGNEEGAEEKRSVAFYSAVERLSNDVMLIVEQDEIRRLRRLARRFSRRMATRPGQRNVIDFEGRASLKISMRKSIGRGGLILDLEKVRKSVSHSKFVILADVSGSMELETQRYYLIFHLLKDLTRRCEIFLFSTRLERITPMFTGLDMNMVATKIAKMVSIWGSGTRIGYCFETLLKNYPALIDHRTTVLIISDGWDLGEPEALETSMKELKRRANKIIWLNPLAQERGYEPTCVGMQTAMRYVDIFATPEIFERKSTYEKYFGKVVGPK